MAEVYRVLFVCTGNTCRSPIAQWVLRREVERAGLGSAVLIDSAGLRPEVTAAAADPRAQAVLCEHGYGFEHAVRQFEPAMLGEYDLVIGLDSMHVFVLGQHARDAVARAKIRLLGSFDPAAGAGWDVPDPFGGDLSDYERTLRLIESAAPGVLAEIMRSAGHGV